MGTSINAIESAAPTAPRPLSQLKSLLVRTGIPPSWLSKRPRLPSRNWLIFLGVISSTATYFYYDRRECKRIRQMYKDRVQHLAELPADSLEWPREILVYGSKWPGDEDYDRSLKYFRRYLKPIFVAAAVDYKMVNGKRHGELAQIIADEIKSERRLAAGLDQMRLSPIPVPTHRTPEQRRLHKLKGGSVIVGRHTFKEFMAGLKRGWTHSLEEVDREELLARKLQEDATFDESEPPFEQDKGDREKATVPPYLTSPIYSQLQLSAARPPPAAQSPSGPVIIDELPVAIPPQPPILFVPFIDYLGFTQIPLMLWDFFNQRHHVEAGAKAAYKLIMQTIRPFQSPSGLPSLQAFEGGEPSSTFINNGDLDFDKQAESYYKSSLSSTVSDIEKARTKYYQNLPARLQTARDLARGDREPTKDERNYPPPTEVQLQAERLNKEMRWRNDLEGWDIVRPEAEVAWDERFRHALSVFVEPDQGYSGSPS